LEGALLSDIASHFVRVYAALWAAPIEMIRTNGERIISEHMSHDMNYVSVHKVNI
jgi:hypothetical protein